jgi:dihydroneopterin aldolase/2-amino-4-hydroxy-6-hydroxymethyldihydropteridine diphosphokinase
VTHSHSIEPHVATVALHGLRAHGRHGALPEETALGQEFVIDAALQVHTGQAAEHDDLSATADYGVLATRLTEVVTGKPVALIETLVERLLDVCLADPAVAAATVTVHKPAAPIPLPFGDVTVTASRRRPGVLSLGSNLGDRLAHLQAAVDVLRAFGLRAVSPVYETDPVGGPEQEPYLNAVVLVEGAAPRRLLEVGRAIEASRRRERTVRWGPRTLDVDVIAAGSAVLADPDLVVPHPRAHERAFVLVPWLAVDPAAVLPEHGPVADLVAAVDTTGVRRRDDLELA